MDLEVDLADLEVDLVGPGGRPGGPGGRGGRQGDRPRRPRREPVEVVWEPKTILGKKVASGEITYHGRNL